MLRNHSPMASAAIVFGIDKIALALALAVAKGFGLIDWSWWLIAAPVWAGWPLLWPLARLTEELLPLIQGPRRPVAGASS